MDASALVRHVIDACVFTSYHVPVKHLRILPSIAFCLKCGGGLGLGETAAGLEWLETALAEHDPFLGSAMVFPAYDAIRSHARFKKLAYQLKLSG